MAGNINHNPVQFSDFIIGASTRGLQIKQGFFIYPILLFKFREKTEEEKEEDYLKMRENVENLQKRRREVREEKIAKGEILPPKHKSYQGKRINFRTPDEAHTENRKVSRPFKEELLSLMWRRPTTTLAKEYGVSDNAIRKWAKSYKIPFPPRGYWAKYQNGHKEECLGIKKGLFDQFGLKW